MKDPFATHHSMAWIPICPADWSFMLIEPRLGVIFFHGAMSARFFASSPWPPSRPTHKDGMKVPIRTYMDVRDHSDPKQSWLYYLWFVARKVDR